MDVSVRLFAMLRETAGTSTVALDVAEGSTVEGVASALETRFPVLGPLLARSVAAVNLAYVARDQQVRPGDEVAFIPPVSGGGLDPFRVTDQALDAAAAASLVRRPGHGAVLVFEGVVRDNANGRPTSWLEYEAYPELAERLLREVGGEAQARFSLEAIVIWHRIGRLHVGETSLVVALGTPHRGEAFDAARWVVDRVKQRVPVWKKEVGPDGSYWVEGSIVEPGGG